jgi:hypothetical protein
MTSRAPFQLRRGGSAGGSAYHMTTGMVVAAWYREEGGGGVGPVGCMARWARKKDWTGAEKI